MAIHTMNEETPGSISSVLDELNQGRKFKGEPLTGKSADISGKLPTEPLDEETVFSGHPAEESPGATSDSAGEPSGDPQFKYASHEEAEAAALQTERAVAQLSNELQEVQDLTLKTLQVEGQGQPPAEAPETPHSFATKRRKQVFDEIEQLDLDDEDYKERVADAQAKADTDILDHFQGVRDADERFRRGQREGIQTIIGQAEGAMKEAGLDASPESDDSVLFWALTQTAPREKDGVPLSVDEQIRWTVKRMKTYKNKPLETYKAEEAEESESTQQGTLGSVVDAVTESRRM